MLILAGVSINAVIGDNGILTRTQYASFLNEMAAVEEAVQLWQTGEAIEAKGEEQKTIPANGLCKANELMNTERLVGEVGYYRIWSMSETQPATNILSDASTFNSAFEDELVRYPAGVQDLYYLNNDALEIKGNKTYLIDAATGMIYSMTGIGLKGVRCYSSNMAKAIMNGESTAPLFAEAEVSGTGSGEKLAGNVSTEYLMDENGNYILDESGNKINNPDYNPYGFQIIAAPHSNNIFKLYNNGDLYGKGLKGIQLNSSAEEMREIDTTIWQKYNMPDNVPGIKKIVCGKQEDMFFIDSEDNVWVYGNNSYNRFGLSQDQQVQYTGREATKVDLGSAKALKIFPTTNATYIVTQDNRLLAAGNNNIGQLGIGTVGSPEKFTEVKGLSNVQNIEFIESYSIQEGTGYTIIRYSTGEIFVNGVFSHALKSYSNSSSMEFKQIWDGKNGANICNQIKEIYMNDIDLYVLMNDGSLYVEKGNGYKPNSSSLISSDTKDTLIRVNLPTVNRFWMKKSYAWMAECIENDKKVYYCFNSVRLHFGSDIDVTSALTKMSLSQELEEAGVKEAIVSGGFFFLGNNGKVYGAGPNSSLGVGNNIGNSTGVIDCGISDVETFYDSSVQVLNYGITSVVLAKKGNEYYTTANSLEFGDNILQKTWKLVASNVKYFNGKDSIYVDNDGYLWVAGDDSRSLGLGALSESSQKIQQYVKVTDSSIAGKVKEARKCGDVTYVLTKDSELWATGLYNTDSGGNEYPGWSEAKAQTTFVKILDNVEIFSTGASDDYLTKIAFTKDGKGYYWGLNYNGLGIGSVTSYTPTQFTFPAILENVSNIKYWLQTGSFRNFCITQDGKPYISGSWYHMFNGGNTVKDGFTEFTAGLTLQEDENIIKIVNQGVSGAMFLTNQGRVFAYGAGKTMGIGNSTTDTLNCQLSSGINDVIQIVSGNGWYVAVKSDGTVWGTGSNQYGILGRWMGIDRSTPNSRYKTAFEWVECPELEI